MPLERYTCITELVFRNYIETQISRTRVNRSLRITAYDMEALWRQIFEQASCRPVGLILLYYI